MAEKKPTIPVDPSKKCKVKITLYVDRDEINARKNLEQCKVTIVQTKPTSTNFDYVDRVLHPSNQKDWQLIRYFSRISRSIKDEFRENQKYDDVVTRFGKDEGKRGKGNAVGQHWDKELSKIIQKSKAAQQPTIQRNVGAEYNLLKKISTLFGRLKFLDSHFPLYGYMYSKTEKSPKVYLWQGDADAVGWYRDRSGMGRYVIVDWKVLDILEFWKKNADAYGKYLHQCLVYARLLQLHLELDYLPHILIVPISGETGRDVHPALFSDYPERCKELIENFEWSTTPPEPAQKISGKLPLFNDLPVGKVDKNKPLKELFNMDAKVSDLLEVFGWHSLEVTADEIKKE